VWGYAVLRCPACGAQVGPDFVFCHVCGSPIRPQFPGSAPHLVYPPSYPPVARPTGALWETRTKRGITVTILSLILLWIPGATIVGGALLSVGSILMFWGRHPFSPEHRRAILVAYVLLWVAALLYVIVFVAFVLTAYEAWASGATMDRIQPATVAFVWVSTIPTELLVVALALQVLYLLPPRQRRHVPFASVALGGLVLVATVLAHLAVAPGVGSDFVRMSSVLGVLNQISLGRLVEGPGFAWFAYLYYRARGAIVPKAARPGEDAPSIPAP